MAAKESGLSSADKLITGALMHALRYCIKEQGQGFLVPIPSRKAVARLRGRQFISHLSLALSEESGLPTFENLRHTRVIRDQSSLDAKNRFINNLSKLYFLHTNLITDSKIVFPKLKYSFLKLLRFYFNNFSICKMCYAY